MDHTSGDVAPLNIVKGKARPPVPHLNFSSSSSTATLGRTQRRITPPETPHSPKDIVMSEAMENSPPVFHNYLRAFYPFHPSGSVSPSTVTLPLNQGDIILVHSVHVNGWADGTLLETGDRGWLPTNYCEAYDQVPMRPLLKALTDFWDIIRGGCGTLLGDFGNQDLMRGLIAGVRFLLVKSFRYSDMRPAWPRRLMPLEQEKAECLTREAVLVQRYDGLRRNRKALLADLSSLVKTAKRLQDVAADASHAEDVDQLLDDMLLRSFRIVTRGVRFLDVWNEHVGLTRAILDLEPHAEDNYASPLQTPSTASFPSSERSTTTGSERNWSRPIHSQASNHRESSLHAGCSQPPPSLALDRGNRISVSHRVSYTSPAASRQNADLASVRLGSAYDAFLGVLGSFIGLHLQSRSSTELIVTTQQSVASCQVLLNVVESIWRHDYERSLELGDARNTMYDRISELVHAARDIFRPSATGEEVPFLPDEGKRLVNAATDCVRGAGSCVALARGVLEQIGDFEVVLNSTTPPIAENPVEAETQVEHTAVANESRSSTLRVLPPPISIPEQDSALATPALTTGVTSSSTTSHPDLQSPKLDVETSSTPHIMNDISPSDSIYREHASQEESQSLLRYETRGTTSTGSSYTYKSTIRDSEMSGVSQTSTRATSPDIGHASDIRSLKESLSRSTLAEDNDEAEASVLGKTYAHELMFKDGQVVGGSLRALIERLTAHESTPDALFVSTFYLTFRLFASPLEFAESLADRFDYIADTPNAAGPVRLRVYNILKGWLETHWRHDCDTVALPFIIQFSQTKLMEVLPSAGARLIELADKVSTADGAIVPRLVSSIGKTNTSIAQYISPETPLPAPVISKSQLNLLKQWKNTGSTLSILDFDPLELARQITIKESRIFCSILPEELLATEWMKKSGSMAVNVRAMSTLSTDLANLVADSILYMEEPKKRALVIKQWVKISNKCLELNNYDSLMAIICSLNSTTIVRLQRTWELVSQKTKASLESLKEVVDISRNYAVLRQRLQNCSPPTLPFVGVYLTDLTFVDHGNPATRTRQDGGMTVINYDKHVKTAKIISELQRFQIPYRLTEVPELQTWMQDQLIRVRSAGEKSFQNYYRRSLILEPKETSRPTPTDAAAAPAPARDAVKDRFDFLTWSHNSKAKSVATTS